MEQGLLFKNYFLLDLDITPSIPRCRKNCASPAHCFVEHLELVLRRTFHWFCFETIDVSIQEPSAHHHFPARKVTRAGEKDEGLDR